MKQKSAKRNFLNLPHLPRANFKFASQMPPLCSRGRKFKILRRLQKLNLKAATQNVNLNRSANLAARTCANRPNLKFHGAAFIAKLGWRLLLPLFKILNLLAHPVFQLIHKRGYVIINRTLPLLLVEILRAALNFISRKFKVARYPKPH
nr:hypothetical protein [uncultured Campylobacter sp.]